VMTWNGLGNTLIFDGSDYTYWKAHIHAYPEAVDPECWEVPMMVMSLLMHVLLRLLRPKKILFEGISMDVFSRIDVSGSAIEI
jgi:hypothetical protein